MHAARICRRLNLDVLGFKRPKGTFWKRRVTQKTHRLKTRPLPLKLETFWVTRAALEVSEDLTIAVCDGINQQVSTHEGAAP